MTGRMLTDLADVLRRAGLDVVEWDGWRTRARSSGGYPPEGPWAVAWHHTASDPDTTAEAEAIWQTRNSPDRPIANVNVARHTGQVWVLAAGPTNTNGKGGPLTLPDGRVLPANGANPRVFGMEIANAGVGEPYPQCQIDAALAVSLAVADAYGFRPDNAFTHAVWAPTRKIDPATAAAVHGPWRPRSVGASGTWNLEDLRAELNRRATSITPPFVEDDMTPEQDQLLRDIRDRLFGVTRAPGEGEDPAMTRLLDRADGSYIVERIDAPRVLDNPDVGA